MKRPTSKTSKMKTKSARPKPKRTKRPTKAQLAFAARCEALGLNQSTVLDMSLLLALEFNTVAGTDAERAVLRNMALKAFEEALYASDNPDDWTAAGRKAGGIDASPTLGVQAPLHDQGPDDGTGQADEDVR